MTGVIIGSHVIPIDVVRHCMGYLKKGMRPVIARPARPFSGDTTFFARKNIKQIRLSEELAVDAKQTVELVTRLKDAL